MKQLRNGRVGGYGAAARQDQARQDQGFVLVTGLVFLLLTTIIAVTGMRISNLDFRMGVGTAQQTQAFQGAETGLASLNDDVMYTQLFEREWTAPLIADLNANLEIRYDNSGTLNWTTGTRVDLGLFPELNYATDPFDPDADTVGTDGYSNAFQQDARFRLDVNSDGDYADPGEFEVAMAVVPSHAEYNAGSGIAMLAGYKGLGKSAGSAGASAFYALLSEGQSGPSIARSASLFRYLEGAPPQ